MSQSPINMLQVKGVSEPVSEAVFLESLKRVAELKEAPELLNDGMLVRDRRGDILPGCAGASQTKAKLSREVHRVLRRKGLMGQAGIDQQHRLDNNIEEPLTDARTGRPLVFPTPVVPSPVNPSVSPPASHTPPLHQVPGGPPPSTLRPLYPEKVKAPVVAEIAREDREPESLDGWASECIDVDEMPLRPAHRHPKSGEKHLLHLAPIGPGVSVAYCSVLKTVYYLTLRVMPEG